jgi:catechol 2,3-dioxygenase-like lactoylglutathione lyase family enzyme
VGHLKEIDHIALKVKNIKSAVSWYCKNLKAEVIEQYDDWAFLQFKNIKLALVMEGRHPPHIAIEVHSIEEVDSRGKGKLHRDGSYSAYVAGPDGNVVEYIFYGKK